ncbi:MAG TPA: adenylate/guanylate cyclase domain-containing protein [Actinomycetota bacterium]|nr:adenylate/guanylate cyclase domain-containing protein [Actinomycetota bacterium]
MTDAPHAVEPPGTSYQGALLESRRELPTGTITFLFTDIEGSTRLVQRLGEGYYRLLERHQAILRDAWARHGGVEVLTEGDSFFVVFPSAPEALAAAVEGQRALETEAWPEDSRVRVRMGLHTGEGILGAGSYVGVDVHRAARIAAAGHGGQILVSESTRALVSPDGISFRDLGSHRLKDLLEAERIHQVEAPGLATEFPPLATLTSRPNNLPTQTSVFLGRDEELARIREAFDEGARLVTLIGPGGIGKTRLALHAAAELSSRLTDGVFFVDLSPVRDAGSAFEAVVRAVGEARTDEPALEQLERTLQPKRVLLLLDNLEQVMDMTEGIVHLVQRCPSVHVLVTSREALRVRDERLVPIPPLALPSATASPEELLGSDAVRLFLERAREQQPSFDPGEEDLAAIGSICARLDGLPLGIELAAARLNLFSPSELRDRLRDRVDALGRGARDLPERQRTIRSTIAWSYELLEAQEQAIFRLLSVFSSAHPDTVEAVASEAGVDADVLETLDSLIAKSLVRTVATERGRRLTMLGIIREYARERLSEDPLGDTIERAHAEHAATFASSYRDRVHGPGRGAALELVEVELDNLLVAWRYWIAAGDLERLDMLLDALWALHDARGWYHGAAELTNGLLDVLGRTPSSPERAVEEITVRTSLARALMAIRGYTAEVEATYRRALELAEEVGGIPERIPVLRSLVSLHLYRGESEEGIVIARQLLALAEQQGDRGLMAEGNLHLGTMTMSLGDAHGGMVHLRRAIELFDPEQHGTGRFRLGPSPGVSSRTTLGFILWLTGHADQAHQQAWAAIEVSDRIAQPYSLAYARFHVGLLNAWERRWDRTEEMATEVLDIAGRHEFAIWKATSLVLNALAQAATGRRDEAVGASDAGVTLYRDMTAPPIFWPLILWLRARTLAYLGRPEDGLDAIDSALTFVQGPGRPDVLAAQFPAVRADLLAAVGDASGAAATYRHAIDIAHQAGARMSELQATIGLAKVTDGGERHAALEQLARVYAGFTEGLDAPDVVAAREMLAG